MTAYGRTETGVHFDPAAIRERALCQGLMEGMPPFETRAHYCDERCLWRYAAEEDGRRGFNPAGLPRLLGRIAALMALTRWTRGHRTTPAPDIAPRTRG